MVFLTPPVGRPTIRRTTRRAISTPDVDFGKSTYRELFTDFRRAVLGLLIGFLVEFAGFVHVTINFGNEIRSFFFELLVVRFLPIPLIKTNVDVVKNFRKGSPSNPF